MPDRSARVTISEVRQEIFRVAGRPAEGVGSTPGQIFHLAAACSVSDEHPACWKKVLSDELDEELWLATIYESVVGPELMRLQGVLADGGEEVLRLWRATRQYVHWFCGLLREAIDRGQIGYDGQREEWLGAESLFQAECEAQGRLFEQGWSQPVLLCGRVDQFIRSGPDRWCVIEFKLGGGHPEADAAQVCLYHELLGGSGGAALLRFGNEPGAEEVLFASAEIAKARPELMALIGGLAGVSGAGSEIARDPDATVDAEPPGTRKKPGEEETEMGKRLERALREYGAEARLAAEPIVGPAFVRYLLEPLRGVPVSRIERCGANLQVRLGLSVEPAIHRAEGRVAVDVQRREREVIRFDSLRARLTASPDGPGSSKLLAGVDLWDRLHLLDLARECAHILVGGQSGSGKTEWLRAAVASLMVTNTPDTLRLAVVDPKKNAFTELAGSPFLWRPEALVDSPDNSVLDLLEALIDEMTRRNGLLGKAAADDLTRYRQKSGEMLPRVVLVVDEFAELLLSGGRKQRDAFEQAFIRIASVGRAAGIHLILATQRPSRQVVSGNLKANLPGKIALKVATRVDSGVLIDQPGADLLLGSGDLLLAGLSSEPVRLQSPWLSEEQRQRIFREFPPA